MKTKTKTEYQCGVCETTYTSEHQAEECERIHADLAAVSVIGAKVRWVDGVADAAWWCQGVVVGFAEHGKLVVCEKQDNKTTGSRSLISPAKLELVVEDERI